MITGGGATGDGVITFAACTSVNTGVDGAGVLGPGERVLSF